EFFSSEVPPAPDAALPVVTFSETVTFHLGGHTVYAEHVANAHTDGDSIVQLGTPQALRASPSSEWVARVLGADS
ncbi:MAG: hypothetical protein AAF938_17520, partial [Myxococcota bacterium]